MLEHIKTYRKISDTLHTAAQPTVDQFKSIKRSGVDLVINLALHDSPDAIENEADVVQECAMGYIHIPVDFKKPETSDLERFFQSMDQNKEKNVLVHCAYNWRVASFVYLYRVIKQDCDHETARQAMLDIWEPDATWQAFIDTALASKESL
ncbi:MAG: protein tyrosine phosphatase (PTP) superfamily phosphohydrolase (DUF442 family) [Gammaproteobacteria bacterium]|jgi:protein tyrosine phosphatase (PTP) superfamily phosphohydrolase (DUF442 family)